MLVMFPNLQKIASTSLTMPVSTASVERSLSQMKHGTILSDNLAVYTGGTSTQGNAAHSLVLQEPTCGILRIVVT